MKERFLEISSNADQMQEERFEIWNVAEGITFANGEAEAAYRERVTLIKNAIQLKKRPARLPICPSAGFFPIEYAGTTMYDAMYDYGVLQEAWEKYHRDFVLDAYTGPTSIVPGRVLDILDLRLYQWPGHGVSREREYQFVEEEYMREEEYQALIDDPTGFFLNVYFPRIFGSLKPLEGFPLLPPVHEIPLVPPAFMPFGTKAMKTALATLTQAGEEKTSAVFSAGSDHSLTSFTCHRSDQPYYRLRQPHA